jgi:flavin reductase (DIM6/NTAB) family NADH-FMN oxidoreductase RutF
MKQQFSPLIGEGIATADFRAVLGHFCTGVTVVTAVIDGQTAGFTCQSFFSLSLDPPLVAFSPAKSSRSYRRIKRAKAFCVNILAEDQQDLCAAFARSGTDKWKDVAWRPAPSGSPILEGVLAWIDCVHEVEHEAGDHFLTIGRVTALEARYTRPLLYFRGAFANLPTSPGKGA